jgi:ribosomal protein L7/L12
MSADIWLILAVLALALVVSRLTNIQSQLRDNEAKLDALLRHLGIKWGQFAEPSDQVKALARDPKMQFQAIKAYREQTGLGLKEAKEVVDQLARAATTESH